VSDIGLVAELHQRIRRRVVVDVLAQGVRDGLVDRGDPPLSTEVILGDLSIGIGPPGHRYTERYRRSVLHHLLH
jgi:hypothetical protein